MHVSIRPGVCATAIAALLATTSVRATAQLRDVRVDTLEGGRIVVSNPDSPRTGPPGVPALVEVLRIGSLEDTCDSFGDLNSLAVDGDGRIHVADRQTDDIRVFSPRGECVRTIGRFGEGPGEFSWLAGIVWQPPGHLWAIDAGSNRFTVFDSFGTVLATHPSNVVRAAALPWPLSVDTGANLHFLHPGFRGIVKYAPGPGLDSLGSFRLPELGHVRRGYPAHRTAGPPGAETGREGVGQCGVRHRNPRAPTAERKHAIERIRTSPDGWVWIETEQGAAGAWEVFDEHGHYIGRVASPVPIEKEPFPVFTADMLTGVTLGELDEQYVIQLRVNRNR